jgi:hypothetical protein
MIFFTFFACARVIAEQGTTLRDAFFDFGLSLLDSNQILSVAKSFYLFVQRLQLSFSVKLGAQEFPCFQGTGYPGSSLDGGQAFHGEI